MDTIVDNLTRSVGIGSSRLWWTRINLLCYPSSLISLFLFNTFHTLSLIANFPEFSGPLLLYLFQSYIQSSLVTLLLYLFQLYIQSSLVTLLLLFISIIYPEFSGHFIVLFISAIYPENSGHFIVLFISVIYSIIFWSSYYLL